MAIADVSPSWAKTGVNASKTVAIDGVDASTFEYRWRDAGANLWPIDAVPTEEWDNAGDGVPMQSQYSLGAGICRPTFTISGPITPSLFGVMMGSLTQSGTYSSPKTTFAMYSAGAVDQFMHIEAGATAANGAIWKHVGCVCRSIDIDLPAVGSDGGKATMSAEIIAPGAPTRLTAFSTTQATSDTGAKLRTADVSIETPSGTAQSVVSAKIRLTNNASISPNAGATGDAVFLDMLEITGSLTVILTTAASDPFDVLMDRVDARTLNVDIKFILHDANTFIITDARIMKPTNISKQAGVWVAEFPFKSNYIDGNSFSASATGDFHWGA